jgi:hypothetical protein
MELAKELCSYHPDTSKILKLITPENVSYVDKNNRTILIIATDFYCSNVYYDSKVLLKLLSMECKPDFCDLGLNTPLMHLLFYYNPTKYCNSEVLLKLLDLDCKPDNINCNKFTALMIAFQYYGNKKYLNPLVFVKLINLIYPKISRPELIDLLNQNTNDTILKKRIYFEFIYFYRSTILKKRLRLRNKIKN